MKQNQNKTYTFFHACIWPVKDLQKIFLSLAYLLNAVTVSNFCRVSSDCQNLVSAGRLTLPRGQNPIFYSKLHNQVIKTCPIWMDSIDYEQHP